MRRRDEEGSFLVELIVGMVLMSVIGLVVLNGIIGGFQAQRGLQNRGDALHQVRTAAQRVTKQIREAQPLLYAGRSKLVISHADGSGGTQCLKWELVTSGSSSSLVVSTQSDPTCPDAGWGTAVPVIRQLDGSTLPFRYYGTTGTECAVQAGTPATYDPACVVQVRLQLVRLVTGHTPVSVDTWVDLRNVT